MNQTWIPQKSRQCFSLGSLSLSSPWILFLIKKPQPVLTDHMEITAGQEEVIMGLSRVQGELTEGLSGVQEVNSFLLHSCSFPGVDF